MSVTATESTVVILGTGVLQDYPFQMAYYPDDARITVTQYFADGSKLKWEPNVQYRLKPPVDPGFQGPTANSGTIEMVDTTIVEIGETLVIEREEPVTQQRVFAPGNPGTAELTARAVDKLTRLIQQVSGSGGRNVKLNAQEASETDPELALYDGGKALIWDEDRKGFTNSKYNADEIADEAKEAAEEAKESAEDAKESADKAKGSAGASGMFAELSQHSADETERLAAKAQDKLCKSLRVLTEFACLSDEAKEMFLEDSATLQSMLGLGQGLAEQLGILLGAIKRTAVLSQSQLSEVLARLVAADDTVDTLRGLLSQSGAAIGGLKELLCEVKFYTGILLDTAASGGEGILDGLSASAQGPSLIELNAGTIQVLNGDHIVINTIGSSREFPLNLDGDYFITASPSDFHLVAAGTETGLILHFVRRFNGAITIVRDVAPRPRLAINQTLSLAWPGYADATLTALSGPSLAAAEGKAYGPLCNADSITSPHVLPVHPMSPVILIPQGIGNAQGAAGTILQTKFEDPVSFALRDTVAGEWGIYVLVRLGANLLSFYTSVIYASEQDARDGLRDYLIGFPFRLRGSVIHGAVIAEGGALTGHVAITSVELREFLR